MICSYVVIDVRSIVRWPWTSAGSSCPSASNQAARIYEDMPCGHVFVLLHFGLVVASVASTSTDSYGTLHHISGCMWN